MTEKEARQVIVARLLEKAELAIASARREQEAGEGLFASNRVYYACFYAASAALMVRGLTFAKHAALRSAIHQHLVRTGLLSPAMGRFFDEAFAERQEADYNAMADFDPEIIAERIEQAERFVAAMKSLAGDGAGPQNPTS